MCKESLTDWIRQIQFEKKLTEQDCYTRAGMTPQNWSRLVNRPPKYPRMSTLKAIATALQEPLSHVLEVAGYTGEPKIPVITIDTKGNVTEQSPLTAAQGERLEALLLEVKELLTKGKQNE